MKELLQDCKNLDRKAQRKMVDYLTPFLFPICLRYTDSREDAKDLMQESLILIFNNLNSFASDVEAPFRHWCRRITINKAFERKRKKIVPIYSMKEKDENHPLIPSIHSKLNVDDILKLLDNLPHHHRNVFNLAVIDGYAHKEIAKLLEIKESSSRTFLTRARNLLQRLIREENKVRSAN